MADRRPGVLVTGLPRSGTSWVGTMLAASGELVYVNEPLNPKHPPGRSPGVLNAEVTHRFQYICTDNAAPWRTAFEDTLALRYSPVAELRRNRGPYDLARMAKYAAAFAAGRLRGRGALLDDPYATLSAAWFAAELGVTTVVLVRDPVAFVGSWAKLGWTCYFHELLEQPLLMRDLLAPYADELRASVGSQDPVAKNALLWRVTYAALDRLRDTPNLHILRYEDLSRDPERSFCDLYALAGLTWTDEVAGRVRAATSAAPGTERGFAWNLRSMSRTAFRPMDSASTLTSYRERLTETQISRVRALTGDVADRFYDRAPA